MRFWLLNLLDRLIIILEKYRNSLTVEDRDGTEPYHSLSPIGTVQEEQYDEALLWALQNRRHQDIKNIALTGPYGSGKSSILKTFQTQHQTKYKFLNISLATFKEELKEIGKQGKKSKEQRDESKDLLRLIELSILQQIFYHEKDSKIPDSRFKKIRSFKRSHLIAIAGCMLLVFLCAFNLFYSQAFEKFFGIPSIQNKFNIVHYGCLTIFIGGIFYVLYRSIRLLNSVKVSKLKFQDAEIEIDEGISKSILNNHLDEILYFFEVTPYDVVIIEDLDRFEQTEIFTKLRELNLLINNSKKIKKDVTFVYAVRDDMFQDKDRTKFFDFIIPVIPVINSSNSNNKLLEIVRKNDYYIADDLIDDIGLFVDDMRLLYNITNEYHLYRGLLDDKLSQNKLLSMVVYKNIFPNDFVKLSNRDGELYRVFASKQTYIAALQKQYDQEISDLKIETTRLSELRVKDIKELRMLYLVRYPQHLPYFNGFHHINKLCTLTDAADDKLFQLLRDKKLYYNTLANQWSNQYAASNVLPDIDFATIEKEVDPNRSYDERAAEISNDSETNINSLRRLIGDIEKKKTAARHLKIRDLLSTGASKIELEDKKKSLLLNVLMRAGHIDEEYLDYISIFYEGSITKDDRDFLLNVKSQIATDFDFQLQHIDKLIPKIGLNDFEQAYTLNYSLLEFLLSDVKYDPQVNSTIQHLKVTSKSSLAFIDGFVKVSSKVEPFINKLAKAWPQFWQVISTQSDYTDENKFNYLNQIISFADLADIEKLAKDSNLRKTLMSRPTILADIADADRFESVIKTFKLKFDDIDLVEGLPQLVDYVYNGNYYDINATMLTRIIQAKGIYDQDSFDKANYEAIQTSNAPALIDYIEQNLPEYIAMVYLQLDLNKLDPEESLIKLLNSDSLELEDKVAIIDKTTAIISSLAEVISTEIDAVLLSRLRVLPSWDNVLNNFENNEKTLTDSVVLFLNDLTTAEALSTQLISTSQSSVESDELLTAALLRSDTINDNAFEFLVKSISEIEEAPEFSEISEDHVEILIENSLVLLSPTNFSSLKTNFENQHINLAERNNANFIEDIAQYQLDVDDATLMLKSDDFNYVEKQVILESIDEDLVVQSNPLLSVAGRLALLQPKFTLSKRILLAVLTKTLTTADRIKLFNMNYAIFLTDDVTSILQHLPHPYSEIAIKGRRPTLPHGEENNYFANNLRSLGYISKREDERKGIRISTFKK
jgi:hypothetical protein